MNRSFKLQLQRRTSRPGVTDTVPLLKAMTIKLKELTGELVPKPKTSENDFFLPTMETMSVGSFPRGKSAKSSVSHFSSRSLPVPLSRVQENQELHLPSGPATFRSTLLSTSEEQEPSAQNDPSSKSNNNEFAENFLSTLPTPRSDGQMTAAEGVAQPQAVNQPKEGIFMKLLKVSNPRVERKHLKMDDVEYNYLIQLRRRIAKQWDDISPFGREESMAMHSPDKNNHRVVRPCRKGAHGGASNSDSEVLPVLNGSKNKQKSEKSDKNNNKTVVFKLPRFT